MATDGDFNVGVVDAGSLEDFVARKRDSGIYLSILGFGSGNYNDLVAQKLAQSGNGVAAYIDTLDEAKKVLVREITSSMIPIAKDLKFQIEFNPAVVREYRLIGYETRILNREDFNNDAVDAGDIGSGHSVTALYEINLVNSDYSFIDDLRYQEEEKPKPSLDDEIAFLKLRYKHPDKDESELITAPIFLKDMFASLDDAPKDARFAAAVAAFAQKLKESPYLKNMSYQTIGELAVAARGEDEYGLRNEFVSMVLIARDMK